jgi:phasin
MVAKKDKVQVAGFEMPKFDVPQFEMPKMDMPAGVREFAEKGVAQAKEAYERMKSAAEETTDMIEDAYAAYSKGAVEMAGKAIDFSKANTVAAFDFAKEIMGVKSVAELVEKQSAFARAQFEAMASQGKELQTLAQKVANDTAAPYKVATEKAVAEFKKSA